MTFTLNNLRKNIGELPSPCVELLFVLLQSLYAMDPSLFLLCSRLSAIRPGPAAVQLLAEPG